MPSPKFIGAAALTAALAAGGIVGATLGTPLTSGAATDPTTTTIAGSTGSDDTDTDAKGGERGPGRGMGGGVELEAAAEALGMTVDELRTALDDDTSIADVAAEKGVDKQTVIDAMVAAAETRLEEAKAALPERMAAVVDGTMPTGGPGGFGGPGGHRGGPGGGHGGMGLSTAAEALGVTEDDLRTALQDGKTIAAVAEEKGVDLQKVIDAMVADTKTHLAEEVESGRITQAQADERLADLEERITEMVSSTRPAGRPGEGD
jgi:hypothetical protein